MNLWATQDERQVQLLGEIQTEIVGLDCHSAGVEPGDQINLEREPKDVCDPEAIRVRNGRLDPVGYLPRKIASWLTPLVDGGQLRVDGFVPTWAACGTYESATTCPLVLSISLTRKGRQLLEASTPGNDLEARHQRVRQAYLDAQHYHDPGMINGLAQRLGDLARGELLPATRLLLALLPDVAREVRASRSLQTIAVYRALLRRVSLGQPVHHHHLTLFPLRWPEPCQPSYTLLSQAIEAGEAAVEEIHDAGSVPTLAVTNRGRQPLLIPEGERLIGPKQSRVSHVTALVAAGTTFVLPVGRVSAGRWRHQAGHFESKPASSPTRRKRHGIPMSAQAAGVVVGCNGEIVGMDLFDAPETLKTLWGSLVDVYFANALRDSRPAQPTATDHARRFLERLTVAARPRVPALALGDELEIAGDGMVGAALLYSGRLCHLAAFSNHA